MHCTRCQGSGFLNMGQVPDSVVKEFEAKGDHEVILTYIKNNIDHDVGVCDCCGDGDSWYGQPGEHTHADGKWDTPGVPECI